MSLWASTWAYEQDIQPCGRKFVLVALASFADEKGFCFPSQETLAIMTGQDPRSVRRHLVELEKSGLIKREHRYDERRRTSDGYSLLAPSEKLKPKSKAYRTNRPLEYRTNCPVDRLSADLSIESADPLVKNPLPLKKSHKPPLDEVGEHANYKKLVEYLAEQSGPLAVNPKEKKAAKRLGSSYDIDQCFRCFRYLQSQEWRDTAVLWTTVEKEIGTWVEKGEPQGSSEVTSPVRVQTLAEKMGIQRSDLIPAAVRKHL